MNSRIYKVRQSNAERENKEIRLLLKRTSTNEQHEFAKGFRVQFPSMKREDLLFKRYDSPDEYHLYQKMIDDGYGIAIKDGIEYEWVKLNLNEK